MASKAAGSYTFLHLHKPYFLSPAPASATAKPPAAPGSAPRAPESKEGTPFSQQGKPYRGQRAGSQGRPAPPAQGGPPQVSTNTIFYTANPICLANKIRPGPTSRALQQGRRGGRAAEPRDEH
jgi:hypothetical protein